MPTNIYIVEDHPLMREMLTELIEEDPDFRVCGVASSGEDALDHAEALNPHLLLIDISLPRMSGIEFVLEARQRWPLTRLVMLSGHGERHYAASALSAGANGFVVKGNPDEIVDAIRQVFRGETYLSASVRDG